MRTSQNTTFLAKPSGDEAVEAATFAYVKGRARQQAYNLLVKSLKESGITQATLARRSGSGSDVISRILRRPRNLELDTLSALIYSVTGAFITFGLQVPSPRKQYIVPDVTDTVASTSSANAEVHDFKFKFAAKIAES